MLALWEFFYTSWPAVIQTMTASMSVTTSDQSGAQGVSKLYIVPMQGSVYSSYTNLAIPTSVTNFTLPIGNATGGVNFIYVKNTGNFPVTITLTPYQGVSAVVRTLQPGGFIFDGNSALGSGITALSMQAVGGASTVDCVLFG